jgi:hypothetical protein
MTTDTEYMPDVMAFGDAPAITVEDLVARNKLFSIDQGYELLRSTEPLAFRDLTCGPHLRFKVDGDNWAEGIDDMHGTEAIPVYINITPALLGIRLIHSVILNWWSAL